MTGASRAAAFQRNEKLERLLKTLNDVLEVAESSIAGLPRRPRFPVLLVIGAPRSGTTLLMQWLAATGCFAYPSNLLSRFFAAPYVGAMIQQLLTDPDYNYKNELADLLTFRKQFASEVGKTKGVLEPNEFWYFWRRFIPNMDPEWISPEHEARIDGAGLLAGIASIEAVFGKPFATKGIILQYNLACLKRILGNVLFIHTIREPFYNTQSLLKARRDYYGSEEAWFSVKPKEYPKLRDLDPVAQVAGQVRCTVRSIQNEFSMLDPRYCVTVQHEAFCRDPASFYAVLRDKLAAFSFELPAAYHGQASFEVNNRVVVDSATKAKIEAALNDVP
jgi:hypothetical protein